MTVATITSRTVHPSPGRFRLVPRKLQPRPRPFARQTELRSPYHANGDLASLRAESPCRPVDWRYKWALALLESGRIPEAEGDHHIARIFELLRLTEAGARAVTPVPEKLVPYRHATDLHFGPDEPERAVLEAHLLAHSSVDLAAKALNLSPNVVQAYEATYFNIVDRRSWPCYIAHFVLRSHRPPQPTLGYVLRSQAYAGGPAVLDDLLWHFGLGQFALRPPHQHEDPVLHDLWLRAHIAVLLMPPTLRAMAAMTKLLNRIEGVEYLRKRKPDRYRKELLQARRALIKQLRWKFGARAIRKHPFLAQLLTLDDQPQ